MKPIEVTDGTFQKEVVESPVATLVDFWAVWCAPCRMIAPAVEELATEYHGKLKVAKVDVDHNPDTAMKYGIRSIPTLLLFKDGKVVDQVIGAVSKRVLVDKVSKHIG
ncbi:MAG: thioredoxin [Ignavibacteriales bacterium CG07_land_8_20_14_0_80_59_12]|jgi:thioredoxin 1|nr:MAG: thioredoxin [Ignavibacteriales bacterium CG07_land_8_20_14_0_80_59_12]